MKLFQFAFCYDYDRKVNILSGLCPENGVLVQTQIM